MKELRHENKIKYRYLNQTDLDRENIILKSTRKHDVVGVQFSDLALKSLQPLF